MQPNRKTIVAILWIMLPLLAGAAIYLFLSPSRRIFFEWVPEFQNAQVDNWIVYSLPDGLWAFSLVLFLLFALRGRTFIVAAPAISAALMPEFLQGLHIFPGTFDWTDVIFILLFGGAAVTVRKLFAVKSEGGSYSLRPVIAGGGIIVFMVIAMGTSPDEPHENSILVRNKTGKPIRITVEEQHSISLDSGAINPRAYHPYPDSVFYYVFAGDGRGGNYGCVRKKKAHADSIIKWQKNYRMSERGFTTHFDELYATDTLFTRFDNSPGTALNIQFWLFSDSTHAVTIPEIRYKNDTLFYPVYKFSYMDNKGRLITRRLRGGQFYRYLDKTGTKMTLE